MNIPALGPNVALFLLFFGIALLDALRAHDWVQAAFWAAIGLVFLRGDLPLTRRQPPADSPRG
jgi:hypothetical protein